MAEQRIPPQNLEAEQSVLGAILIDKDAIIRVADSLQPSHFYKGAHASIFQAILNLFEKGEPFDMVTVPGELRRMKVLKKIGGMGYLTDLVNFVPTAANIEYYGRLIKDCAIKRRLITAATEIAEAGFSEGRNVDEMLDEAEQSLFSVSQEHLVREFVPIKKTLEVSFDRLDELFKTKGGLRGVSTGLKSLDSKLSGFQESNLIILAGRPSVGKSALVTNIVQLASTKRKVGVGFFSLEMSREQLVDRMLASQADVDAWRITTGNLTEDDFKQLGEAMGELAEAPIFIDDTPGISVMEMRTKARRLQLDQKVGMIVVDYLQLVKGRGLENRVQEVSEISQALKNLARELRIPVIACSQLSRAVESRGNPRPQLSDLRESGCLLGDSKIMRADTGELVSIKSLADSKGALPILTIGEDLKLGAGLISKAFSSGVKKVYELKLKSGRSIKASANHPFLAFDGWKRLDRLVLGDWVAVPRIMPQSSGPDASVPDERVILLAHLIGDGCYVKKQPLHYTNSDPACLDIVAQSARTAFGAKIKLVKQENWFHLYLKVRDKRNRAQNAILAWLRELGVFNQRSPEKHIPSLVFRLPLKQLALFLRHLWATDGCIFRARRGHYRIYFATSSRDLAEQLSHLLLRFGVNSRLRTVSQGKYQPNYHVDVSGSIEQLKFLENIGIFGRKDATAKKALRELSEIESNPNVDVIPREVWAGIEEVRVGQGLSTREFHHRLGWAYSGTGRHRNGLSRQRLSHVLTVLENEKLTSLAQSDVLWDRVEVIKYLGEEEVYDATVPGTHNFIANDIVVHNSIEQDADVVMFLYRPDPENRSEINLLIAKHRAGPTGEISLYFRGDRVKFYETEKAVEK